MFDAIKSFLIGSNPFFIVNTIISFIISGLIKNKEY